MMRVDDARAALMGARETPEEVFRAMADCAPVLLWMSGIDGLCTFFNQTWLEFTGRSMEEELGAGWAEGVHPEDFEGCMSGYMEAFRERRVFELIYRLRRRDGAFRWILDRGVPRSGADGSFCGYIGSCVDITERKQYEETIQRSLREKQLLLDEVLHRVRNNLQVVQGLLEMHARRIDGPAQDALLDTRNRVQSMALIHSVLYHNDNIEWVDFPRFLEAILPNVRRAFGAECEHVAMHASAGDVRLPIDKAIPCGLIVNELVSNAFKYGFRGARQGNVWVSLQRANPGCAVIEVSNDGLPMPQEHAAESGRGLGLMLVRLLVEQIGGELSVQRAAPVRFTIRVPLAPTPT